MIACIWLNLGDKFLRSRPIVIHDPYWRDWLRNMMKYQDGNNVLSRYPRSFDDKTNP